MSLQSAAAAVPCGGLCNLTLLVIQYRSDAELATSAHSLVRAEDVIGTRKTPP
jgi:hypothetical protein